MNRNIIFGVTLVICVTFMGSLVFITRNPSLFGQHVLFSGVVDFIFIWFVGAIICFMFCLSMNRLVTLKLSPPSIDLDFRISDEEFHNIKKIDLNEVGESLSKNTQTFDRP